MIPLIIPNFNQLTYLKQLITWWHFYHPDYPVHIIDNGSTYEPLLKFYEKNQDVEWIKVHRYPENDCVGNLQAFLKDKWFAHYVISDPDIMPHPATPPNFLEYFKQALDAGYHHAGFDLIYEDIPAWNPKAEWIKGDQRSMQGEEVKIGEYTGKRCPIDTTFALYSCFNGGWTAPMSGKDWSSSVRLFKAFHLTWYLHSEHLNEEMKNYFATCQTRDITKPSAGRNHFNPFNGIN